MSFIKTGYQQIMNYFYGQDNSSQNSEIPEHLKGVWSLENIKNMSILMTLENGVFEEDKRRITVKLYEKGNWLFREENFFTKFLCKCLKYSYQFDFNEDYTFADIYIKLGKLPLYFRKSIMDWSVEFRRGKMVRYSSIFGNAHLYESTKFSDLDVDKFKSIGINKLYYS